MKSPYMNALKRPLAGVSLPFMKKETVIGTIGNTQGVRSIAKPQSIASSIRDHSEARDPCSAGAGEASTTSRAGAATGAAVLTEEDEAPKEGTDEDLR